MGSSKVEIPSSSSRVGYVLNDHNYSERHRESKCNNPTQTSQTSFQKNLRTLVRNHLHSCISIPTRGSGVKPDENSQIENTSFGCWDENHSKTDNKLNNTLKPTLEARSYEVERQSLSKCHSISSRTSSTMRDASPTPSDCSSSDLSVSSLVQKWRGLEAEARHSQCNKNNGNVHGHSPCSMSINNNNNGEIIRACANMPTQENTRIITSGENNMQGHKIKSKPSQCTSQHEYNQQQQRVRHKRTSSREEKDRIISVADMVRAWANTYQVTCAEEFQEQQPSFGDCLVRLKSKKDLRGKNLISSPVVCSPKLRGRKAIVELFLKMEKERYKEIELIASCHVVTKFPQRGRIQTLLRLRYLRQEASTQKQCQPQSDSMPGGTNQSQIASSVNCLRERFCMTTKQDTRSLKYTFDERSTNNMKDVHNFASTSKKKLNENNDFDQQNEETNCYRENNTNSVFANNEDDSKVKEKILLRSIQVSQEQSNICLGKNSRHPKLPEVKDPHPLFNNSMINIEEQNISPNVQKETTRNESDDHLNIQDEAASMTMICTNSNREEENIHDQHEMENNDLPCFETSLDWILDISRPRTYWEDQRKAWYDDVINTPSKNEDIRQLIKRGNVSSILASDFRETMDRIMMNTIQRVMHSSNNEGEEEGQSMQTFLEQQQLFFTNHREKEPIKNQQFVQEQKDHYVERGDEQGNHETSEDREMSSELQQYQDVSDYEQTPSPSRYPEDEPSDDDFDQIGSTSLNQPPVDHSFYSHPNEGSSFKNISSIEVELIYDLRTHMQQLYHEMFELRKSITSCVDMQLKLQNSIKEEVSAAINQIDEEKSDSNGRHPKRGFCCICYEKKIDSLLYRCGHMCTCFSCANELQCSSGKCPICRAHIVDVVRTYRDK